MAESFGNIFARNSINNALLTLDVPKLVERLRASFPALSMHQKQEDTEAPYDEELLEFSPSVLPREKAKVLTRRTGWYLTWDVRSCKVEIDEGHDKRKWSFNVGELPANVQKTIADGGLEKWVKSQKKSNGGNDARVVEFRDILNLYTNSLRFWTISVLV